MEIQVTSILLQMLNFAAIAGGLTFLLFKPVRAELERRAQRIAEGQKAADVMIKEREQVAELKAKAQKEARQEAKVVLEEARKDADARKATLLAEAKAEAAKEREKGRKAGERERQALIEQGTAELEGAVLAISASVIGANLDEKKSAALIRDGLKKIAAAK